MSEMELWGTYGSKSDYLKAPKLEALHVRLILSKRHELEKEQAKEDERRQAELDAQLRQLRAQQGD
jgi:hypothetical protein